MIRATTKGIRLHIGLFGRRNTGKSSLLYAMAQQQVSIMPKESGTTADPMEKPMNLLVIGPVLILDTAGVDEAGLLGAQRIEKTRLAIERADIGILVTESGVWTKHEEQLLTELRAHGIPVLIALNKTDLQRPNTAHMIRFEQEGLPYVKLVATTSQGMDKLYAKLWEIAPAEASEPAVLLHDLVVQTRAAVTVDSLRPGDNVLLVESCTHHLIEEDIGLVKITQRLQKYVGGKLEFTTAKGNDFPQDLSPYKLVIHCGACMWNRREMISLIAECHRQGIPITSYGLVTAYLHGFLERSLTPFPGALATYKEARREQLEAVGVSSLSDLDIIEMSLVN